MNYIYKVISFLVLVVLFIGCGSNDAKNENKPKVNSKEYSSSQSCFSETRSIFKNINAPEFTSASSVDVYEGKKNVFTILATAKNGGTISYLVCGRGSEFFNIDSSSGEITFKDVITSDYSNRSSYKVIVKATDSNDNKSTSQTFTINILAAAVVKPDIQDVVADQIFTANEAITPIEFENNGGAIVSCSVTPSLPADLKVELSSTTNNCVLSGTPSISSGSAEYSITATNSLGEDNATINITISQSAPNISDTILSVIFPTQSVGESYIQGLESESWYFNNTGGAITSCELNSTIPGLTVVSNCTITGTPTNAVLGWYTIRGRNSDGIESNDLKVYIHAKKNKLSINDISNNPELIIGQAMAPIQFAPDDDILYCGISPALPLGLTILANKTNKTCKITGTPTETKVSTEYTVRATNALKGGSATITIVVNNPPAPIIADITPNKNLVAGIKITPISFTNTGGRPTSCSSTPQLPTGLSIDTNGTTCEISGTAPSSAIASKQYNITATTSLGGEDNASINIAITVSIARLKTGQTTSYETYDDGNYQKGITREFTKNANKVVDNVTKLEWQDDSDHNNTKYTHSDAITHCQGLDLDGNSDWELPTINELLTIVDYGKSTSSINGTFTNTSSSKYWSATSLAGNSRAWYVNFDSGGMNSYNKTSNLDVRCVRARQ